MNTYNPYAPNPYVQGMQQPQEIGGLNPVFQNISAQQANQNAAMQDAMMLTQQAGQTGKSGGMDMKLMADLLRQQNKKPASVTDYSQPMPNYMDPAYNEAMY